MEPNEILRDESNHRSNWDDKIKQSELSRAVEAEEMNLFAMLDCKLSTCGDQWRVLYGDLESGICGLGDTPRKAIWDFNNQWDRRPQEYGSNNVKSVAHKDDPCVFCEVDHDDIKKGPCESLEPEIPMFEGTREFLGGLRIRPAD